MTGRQNPALRLVPQLVFSAFAGFRQLAGVAVLIATFLLLPAVAAAGDAAVLIIDSSGSMSERQGTETRLDAARAVIRKEVENWPKGRELGMIAYGHRKARDCRDIETILPLGPVNLSAVKQGLDRLRARGKTPLSASLRQAAGLLPPEGGSILLVSDGLETCNEDPCAVAEDLRKAKAGLVIHVIGFGLSEQDMQSLACIAGSSGLSIGTGDRQTLSEALSKAGEQIAAEPAAAEIKIEPAAAEPVPTEEVPPSPPPAPIVAAAVHLVAVVGDEPVPGAVRWQLTTADGTEVYKGESRAVDLDLNPGQYRAAIAGSNATGSADIVVEPSTDGKPAEIRVPIEAGLVQLSMVASNSQEISAADIKGVPAYRIEPLDGQPPAIVADADKAEALLKPGRYRITGSFGSFAASRDITVAAGKQSEEVIDLGLGRITLEAAVEGAKEPVASGSGLDWSLEPKASGTATDLRLEAKAKARPTILAPAGPYTASLQVSGARIDQPVEVVAGKTVTARLPLPSATLTLEAALSPDTPAFDDWRDAIWSVVPKSLIGGIAAGAALENNLVARPVLTLTPGTWTVSLSSGQAKATRDIDIAPGAKVTERLDLSAGRLTVIAEPNAGQALPMNVLVSIFAGTGDGGFDEKPLAQGGTRRDFGSVLPAGRYRVTALDETGRAAEAPVDLASGQSLELKLVLQ